MALTSTATARSAPGITVCSGSVPARLPEETSSGVLWRAAPGRFLLDVPGVARYLVEQGTHITVDPAPDAEPADVERHLRGTPTAAIHLQRGTPVLHAAVVAHPQPGSGAIVLAGDSGAGKSVLAAALWARGYRVLADELAPLLIDHQDNQRPAVLPTGDELVLWPDAVDHVPAVRVTEHGPSGQRRRIDVGDRFIAGPCPVDAIWWLSVHHADMTVREVRGASRFGALGTMAATSRVAAALLDPRSYLASAGALARSSVPIRRVKRPRGVWSAEQLADLVESCAPG